MRFRVRRRDRHGRAGGGGISCIAVSILPPPVSRWLSVIHPLCSLLSLSVSLLVYLAAHAKNKDALHHIGQAHMLLRIARVKQCCLGALPRLRRRCKSVSVACHGVCISESMSDSVRATPSACISLKREWVDLVQALTLMTTHIHAVMPRLSFSCTGASLCVHACTQKLMDETN